MTSEQKSRGKEGAVGRFGDTAFQAEEQQGRSREAGVCLA